MCVGWYNMSMHVLLIGARASGKSTIGRRLARRLGCAFVDLDNHTLARFEQSSVREVFQAIGEQAWRAAELDALAGVLRESQHVIALGGGTPIAPGAGDLLSAARREKRAFVVYLQSDAAVLASRLRRRSGDRPSLTGQDPADEIAAVLRAREPVYLENADLVFAADQWSVPAAAAQLERIVRERVPQIGSTPVE